MVPGISFDAGESASERSPIYCLWRAEAFDTSYPCSLQIGHKEMTTQKIVARPTSLRGFAHLVDQLGKRVGTAIHCSDTAQPEGKVPGNGNHGLDRQGRPDIPRR
jgi:hypothetical protein